MLRLLLISTVFASNLFAADVTITENIFTKPIEVKIKDATKVSKEDFKNVCETWKAEAQKFPGGKTIYTSCGSSATYTLRTITWDDEALTKVGLNFAVFTESTALLVVRADAEVGTIEEVLQGPSRKCAFNEVDNCFNAEKEAVEGYLQECSDYKANAAKNFGVKLLYVTCAQSSPRNLDKGDTNTIRYSSTAKIYYLLN